MDYSLQEVQVGTGEHVHKIIVLHVHVLLCNGEMAHQLVDMQP